MAQALCIDVAQILDLAHLGARRASAFVAIGSTRSSDPELLSDFSLGNTHKHSFWPTPVPKEAAMAAVTEFDSWIIASSLRELHMYFEVFLNQIWYWSKAVRDHGTALPSDYVVEDRVFRDISSVRKKMETIGGILSVEVQWLKTLTSMHFARNCLSHGAGHVRERDLTDGQALVVEWSGMDVYVHDGEEKILIEEAIRLPYQVKSTEGATVVAEVVHRARAFKLGEKVHLENYELAEICTFYTGVAGLISQRFIEHLGKCGVPIQHMPTSTASASP